MRLQAITTLIGILCKKVDFVLDYSEVMMKCFKLTSSLLVIVIIVSLLGCTQESDVTFISANVKNTSLTGVWSSLVETLDIKPSTASTEDFSLEVLPDWSLDALYLVFYASDKRGTNNIYYVNSDYYGEVFSYSKTEGGTEIPERVHPLYVLENLENIILTHLVGEDGCRINMSFYAGHVTYTNKVYPIKISINGIESEVSTKMYHLKDGNLLPLREVVYHTDSYCWGQISIFRGRVPQIIRMGESILESDVSGAGTSEIWFLSSELDKASFVSYAYPVG